ncbi:hypothetical protein [Spirosoma pollinicola]|uniref:Uncharacterized protein n=1 Tax=Spirosoma pollinicola TaxID=2057025 RepID=A0A2K8Z9U9_9BACT|nr:hypothetical protein [Spirosoma pollinicola]AUD06641.1 hypothetical protein CWM47_35220 [Spirosoma pollinicola]
MKHRITIYLVILNNGEEQRVVWLTILSIASAMQNQIASYLPTPSPVILIVYRKDSYQYCAVFVDQTRQQAEELFKEKYPLDSAESYEVKEFRDVESYSVTEDGNLLVNGSYK